jgi:hypothetical protein
MKSFLKEIEKKFENYEAGLTETSRDSKKVSANQSIDSKMSPKRWQDNDGDGIWYEPGVDVTEIKEGYYSSSPLETIIGSLGYRQGFEEFFQDNPGAVDVVVEWIISVNDFRNQLMKDFDRVELERMGIYDLDEASTSGAAGAYMTKNAFGKADDDTIEAMGYRKIQEALDVRYSKLIEGYRSFSTSDPTKSPDTKVKETIRSVAKKLREVEDLVKHTARLKTESGVTRMGYGPATERALNKISETLIKLSERVRSLGE